MVRIKNVCRGLIAFATMVVILMADATCSNGRPVPTTVIMNTKKGVPQLISNWNKSHVPRKVMMDTKKGVPPLISNWNTRPVPSTLTMNTKKAVPPLISNSNTRPVPSTVTMNTKKGVPPLISNVSRFDVLRNFKKGDTHSRLSDLKKFLASFGYLPRLGQDEMPPTSLFDDRLEAAVRLYQTNFNLSDTGILDQETLAILQVPRCGREDVRNGLSVMLPKPKGRLLNDNVSRLPTQTKRIISTHNRSGLPTETRTRLWTHNGSRLPTQLEGQQWKLIGRNIMWQSTRNLTYAFSNFAETAILSSHDIRSAVASAFQSWAAVVPIDFHESVDFESANIKIEFGAGDHGDGWPFDGRLGNLAHAFPPEDGRFHIDSAEVWTVSMAITDDRSAVDLETVALHEIGHLIGLDHSTVHSSVMFPVVETRKVQRHLTADDIEGATALYGCRSSWQEYDIPQHWCHAEWENHEGHQRLSKGHIIAVILARTAIIFTALCSLLLLCLLMKSFLWKSFRWRPLMVG